jgi:hypothetical protein
VVLSKLSKLSVIVANATSAVFACFTTLDIDPWSGSKSRFCPLVMLFSSEPTPPSFF